MSEKKKPVGGGSGGAKGGAKGSTQSLPELVQELIDQGATTVEDVHKAIAALPFDILERIEIGGESAKQIKQIQDETIGAVYDLIRTINRQVGDLATDLLKKTKKR